MIDERGPWSSHPFPNSIISRWKLDKTEDNWRRRPKLKRNYKFDERLCHPPAAKISDGNSQPPSESCSGMRTSFPEQMKQFLLKGVRGITEDKSSEVWDDDLSRLNDSGTDNYSENQDPEHNKDHTADLDIVLDNKDHSSGSIDSDLSEVCLCSHVYSCDLDIRSRSFIHLCFTGSFVSTHCDYYTKEKIGGAFSHRAECAAFFW